MGKILSIVQGNNFGTAISIHAVDAEGHEIQDFSLEGSTDIHVWYLFAGKKVDVEAWTMEDGKILIVWPKEITLGSYDIFIDGVFESTAWRNAMRSQFRIVKYNYEAYIPADVIVLNGIYQLSAEMAIITRISGGGGIPSSTIPLMDGEAQVGTESAYARGDHRHPSDTSKQDVIADLDAIRSGAQKGATAYQKPTNGIPSTEMAQAVQTSLGKADTAFQKPANGIPATDLASGVQTSLGKADTALQTETEPLFTASAAAGITSEDITKWDNKSDFSGNYNDLTNKPTIPAAQVQANWNESDTDSKAYIQNKPTIPAAQVQSNWNESDTNSKAYIQNKPTIPAAGIPSGGNAGQVLTKTDGSTDYAVAWRDTNNIFPSAYCTTAAATAAKGASCTFWTATANSYLHILLKNANTNQGALSLNVNNTGAAPIYINGTVSSSTNYTLPAGSYLVFYDGTNYYFRTDGKLTASITGTADGVSLGSLTDVSTTGATNGQVLGYNGSSWEPTNAGGGGDAVFIYTVDASSVVPGTQTVISDSTAYTAIHAAIEDGKAVYVKWDDGWGEFYPILPYIADVAWTGSYEFTSSLILNGYVNSYDVRIDSTSITLLMDYIDLNTKADKVGVVNHGTSQTTFALTPNTLHIWGTVASLTLTLATPTDATIVNEYMIQFESGSTATTLSLPATVEWAESCGSLSVEASKTYQVSIINNIGLWAAISNS